MREGLQRKAHRPQGRGLAAKSPTADWPFFPRPLMWARPKIQWYFTIQNVATPKNSMVFYNISGLCFLGHLCGHAQTSTNCPSKAQALISTAKVSNTAPPQKTTLSNLFLTIVKNDLDFYPALVN